MINLTFVYTGVDEHCNPVIKLSPNPAHHFINSDHLDIDISDLSKGVYIIIMETKYGINPIKFVKQKRLIHIKRSTSNKIVSLPSI